jgi:hypothetical protein
MQIFTSSTNDRQCRHHRDVLVLRKLYVYATVGLEADNNGYQGEFESIAIADYDEQRAGTFMS